MVVEEEFNEDRMLEVADDDTQEQKGHARVPYIKDLDVTSMFVSNALHNKSAIKLVKAFHAIKTTVKFTTDNIYVLIDSLGIDDDNKEKMR